MDGGVDVATFGDVDECQIGSGDSVEGQEEVTAGEVREQLGDSLEERGGGDGGEGADVSAVGGGGGDDGDGRWVCDGDDAGLADEGKVGEAEGLVSARWPFRGEEGFGGSVAEILEREWS